jgi:DcmR-like sensory protein
VPVKRIGARRERRFRIEDLRQLQRDGRSVHLQTGATPIATAGSISFSGSAHVATFYDSDVGRLRLSLPFLADGLRNGDACWLMAHGLALKAYLDALNQFADIDIGQKSARGQFRVRQTPGGNTTEALEFWETVLWEAISAGAKVIRVVGEMTSVREQFNSEKEMLEYEGAVNLTLKRFPCVAICQYDAREFTGPALLSVLRTHPDLYTLPLSQFIL